MSLPLFLSSEIAACVVAIACRNTKHTERNCAFARRPPDYREDHILRPEIAICGINEDEVSNVTARLIERGFLIGSCVADSDTHLCYLSIGLSATLITKLAVQYALPIVPHDLYTTSQRTFLACQSMDLIKRASFEYTECFLLHRRCDLADVSASNSETKISSYFGPSIAAYFAWLNFISIALQAPCCVGFILFVYQLVNISADSYFVPAACILMSVWSIVFIKYWRQHMVTSVFAWGSVSSYVAATIKWEKPTSEFKVVKHALTGWLLVAVTCTILIALGVYTVTLCIFLQEFVMQEIGPILYISRVPLLLYSFLVPALESRLSQLCEYITDTAPIHTSSQRYNRLVWISCTIQLANRFAGLVYLILWAKDFESASVVLSCMFVADELRVHLATGDDSLFFASEDVQSAFTDVYHASVSCVATPATSRRPTSRRHSMPVRIQRSGSHSPLNNAIGGVKSFFKSLVKRKKPTDKKIRRMGGTPKRESFKRSVSSRGQRAALRRKSGWKRRIGDDGDDSDDDDSVFWNTERVNSNDSESVSSVSTSSIVHTTSRRLSVTSRHAEDICTHETSCAGAYSYEAFLYQEGKAPVHNVCGSHISKILVYTTVVCFSGIYPLAPLLAMYQCNKFIEGDLYRLARCRRPVPDESRWVGDLMEPWISVMEVINVIGIFLNCFIAFLASKHGSLYVPLSMSSTCGDVMALVLCAIFMEHLLLGARAVICAFLPDMPLWIKLKLDQRKHGMCIEQGRNRLRLYADHVTTPADEASTAELSNVASDGCEEVVKSKISALYCTCGWAMPPLFFFGMSLMPCVFVQFSMPLFFSTFPISMVLCAYAYHMKRRWEWDAAMGIITDPILVNRVVDHLPGWAHDSGKNQCQWINKLMRQAWKKIGDIVEPQLMTKANDFFSRKKPNFLSSMTMKNASIGSLPPNIVSMEVLDPIPGSTNVQISMELNWVSDGVITFDIGLLGQTFSIDVFNLRLSGTVRVEVISSDDLDNPMPYKIAKACFMKSPQVDISVNFGDSNATREYSKELGFGPAIAQFIKQTLATRMLFPRWVQVPLIKGVSEEDMPTETPHGVLTIQILSCSSLEIGDITSSDPFVEIKYLDEVVRTEVVYKDLNPVWHNEYFDFTVYDPGFHHIELTVFDYDKGSTPDFLGQANLDLGYMKHGVTKEFDIKLTGVKSGAIQVAVTYFRLQRLHIDYRVVEDILVNLPHSYLNDDIIANDFSIPVIASKTNSTILKQSYEVNNLQIHSEENNSSDVTCSVRGLSNRKVYGIIIISHISCQDLKSPGGTSSVRPFVSFCIGRMKRVTNVARGTLNPVYEESLTFVLIENMDEPRDDKLVVRVKSRNSFGRNYKLGSVVIPLSDITEYKKQEQMVTRALEVDRIAEGYINLYIKYVAASSYVDKNQV